MKNKPFTVSLVYGYSARNAGDFAITLGAIDVLHSLGCRVKVFSRYQRGNRDFPLQEAALRRRYGEDLFIAECPFYLDRDESRLVSFLHYANGALMLLGLRPHRNFVRELLDCDLVAFNGGNLFRCERLADFARLKALLYPLKIARKKGKPFVIMPQSAAKMNKMGQRLVLPVLESSRLAFIREDLSYDYLLELLPYAPVKRSLDMAFFIEKSNLPPQNRKKEVTIALTLRAHTVGDLETLPLTDRERIVSHMDTLVKSLSERCRFVVVVQAEKDEEFSAAFASRHGLEVFRSQDVPELLSFYQSVDVLVGMRLHSIILALSVGTPCYGVFFEQWGLKNPGLMQEFGMPHTILDGKPFSDGAEGAVQVSRLLDDRKAISTAITEKVSAERIRFLDNLKKVIYTVRP